MAEKKVENKTEEKFTVIDGKNLVLGRLGSAVAKRLLLGENIRIVNCKDIVILGKKKFLVERYQLKISNKVIKQGPYYSRAPADLVKRGMRNMLPYKKQRGSDALKRLKCYNSVPSILINTSKTTVENAQLDNDGAFYFTRIEEISRGIGFNKQIK